MKVEQLLPEKPARYVSFDSLLMTNRAVKRTGKHLRIQTAGDNPEIYWLEFTDAATAKRAGWSVLLFVRELRAVGKCNTDPMYNRVLFDWFDRLREGGYIQNLKESEND